MRIEVFMNERNHMCNLSKESFLDLFNMDSIYDLPENKLTMKIVYWLSQYLVGNVQEPFREVNKLEVHDQLIVYKTWFCLIKSRDELEKLMSLIIYNELVLKTSIGGE
ncbi:hypothetical protein PO369_22340 [Phytobacter diazotrophicus]|uniref:hypothetical protein n=1 Tax=Phytobacter diazotrophicus TaxID=395631 RepID=UPI002FF9602E